MQQRTLPHHAAKKPTTPLHTAQCAAKLTLLVFSALTLVACGGGSAPQDIETATVSPATATATATITQVINDNTQPNSAIPSNSPTNDSTPKITGAISAALGAADVVRVYAGTTLLGTATTTGTGWAFTTGTALAAGTHTLKAVVYNAYSMTEGSNTNSWTITVTATNPLKLPHCGITASQCYSAGSNTLMACSSLADDLNAQQDGHRASINAMSYSLVSNASGGSYSKQECVKDNLTGLIWEGKTASGLRAGSNTYTHYDNTGTDQFWNGSTYVPPTAAQVSASTNSIGYVAAVNAAVLCGYSDWRLPTVDELQTIVDYSKPYPGPTVNSDWFINTQSSYYWSSSLCGQLQQRLVRRFRLWQRQQRQPQRRQPPCSVGACQSVIGREALWT